MPEPIGFAEANTTFAKEQPEYKSLPAYLDMDDARGMVVTCWKLSLKERLIVLLTGKLWLFQLKFDNLLQPQNVDVIDPFKPKTRKERNQTKRDKSKTRNQ